MACHSAVLIFGLILCVVLALSISTEYGNMRALEKDLVERCAKLEPAVAGGAEPDPREYRQARIRMSPEGAVDFTRPVVQKKGIVREKVFPGHRLF